MIRSLFIGGALLAAPLAAWTAESSPTEVQRLVRQLDAAQLGQRDAAEEELLRRGPAVLDFLPPTTDRLPAETQQRLGRIRQRLQQAAAGAVADASLVTLNARAMPLGRVLAEFQEQSGNAIVDYRRQFGQAVTDPPLTIRFDRTPFWPALDRLLDATQFTLYPYAQSGAIGVVAATGGKRAARQGHASYSGPFRFEAVRITARRDLRGADGGELVLGLEAAWEPRLRIIYLRHRMADVRAVDERGGSLPVADREAQPELATSGEIPVAKLEIPLRLPPRDVRQIASLRGKLLAMLAGQVETFRFAKLAGAKNVEQRIAGVTVVLEGVIKNGRTWEVRMRARFDEAGDALASHRQWVFSNEAYLEGPDRKAIAYETFETTAQSNNEVGLAYRFPVNRPLGELSFVYKTPGLIIGRAYGYELKGIELP
jgi:hypothetical protein